MVYPETSTSWASECVCLKVRETYHEAPSQDGERGSKAGTPWIYSGEVSEKLLALVQDYQVAEVVVTYSDRLTRFGLPYLTALFSGYGVTLTVLHPDEDTTTAEELTQDLLALLASFAVRLYGLRSRKQKALVDCAKQVLAEAAEES